MKVGFIGLGNMGRGSAARLQATGHSLAIYSRTPQNAASFVDAGAISVDSPATLAATCDILFTCLPMPADVESIAVGDKGLTAGLRPGAAWFDLSTNALDVVRRLDELCAAKGAHFLDAPISGGPKGAAAGTLTIWVGGDKPTFERSKPVLDAIGTQVRHIGPVGAGTIAKLTHNAASAAINAVMAEVLSMGVKAGLDPLTLWDAIRQGAAGKVRAFDNIGGRYLQGKLDTPNFQLRLLQKDISLALQLGQELGVPMRISNLVSADLAEAMERGWGGRDAQAFLLLQQERAGLAPIKLTEDQVNAVLKNG